MSTTPLLDSLRKAAFECEDLPDYVMENILALADGQISSASIAADKISALISALHDFDPYADCGCFCSGTGIGEIKTMTKELMQEVNGER